MNSMWINKAHAKIALGSIISPELFRSTDPYAFNLSYPTSSKVFNGHAYFLITRGDLALGIHEQLIEPLT